MPLTKLEDDFATPKVLQNLKFFSRPFLITTPPMQNYAVLIIFRFLHMYGMVESDSRLGGMINLPTTMMKGGKGVRFYSNIKSSG